MHSNIFFTNDYIGVRNAEMDSIDLHLKHLKHWTIFMPYLIFVIHIESWRQTIPLPKYDNNNVLLIVELSFI